MGHYRIVGIFSLYVVYLFQLWGGFTGLSVEGLFFFSFGAYLSIRRFDFFKLFKRIYLYAICVAIPMLMIMVFTYSNNNLVYRYAYRIFSLTGTSSVIGIVAFLQQKNLIRLQPLLTNSSFFVYCAHVIVLSIMLIALGKVLPANQICFTIKYFSAPIITVALLIICYYCLYKWNPKIMSILTGGRE